jgi:hypothetical protein
MEIAVGVLLEESDALDLENDGDSEEIDETGHVPAAGRRGRHRASTGSRVVEIGEDVLRAAAEAVGHEVALVVAGVVGGIDKRSSSLGGGAGDTGSFDIGDVELKFGVKAVLGAGRAVEALLTASGEATVEVTLKLQKRSLDMTG